MHQAAQTNTHAHKRCNAVAELATSTQGSTAAKRSRLDETPVQSASAPRLDAGECERAAALSPPSLSLCDNELHCIFWCLPLTDRLCWARSCKRLFHAGSVALAWKHLNDQPLVLPAKTRMDRTTTSLLRHVPVTMTVLASHYPHGLTPPHPAPFLSGMQWWPQHISNSVVFLNVDLFCDTAMWMHLVSHPRIVASMKHLRISVSDDLYITERDGTWCAERCALLKRTLASFLNLHTITLSFHPRNCFVWPSLISSLCAPSVTTLVLNMGAFCDPLVTLDLTDMEALRHLTLRKRDMDTTRVYVPALPCLETLHLEGLLFSSDESVQPCIAWEAMTSLHTLTFGGFIYRRMSVNAFWSQLHRLPALTHVCYHTYVDEYETSGLAALLEKKPLLRITAVMRPALSTEEDFERERLLFTVYPQVTIRAS